MKNREINVRRHDQRRLIKLERDVPQNNLPIVLLQNDARVDMCEHAANENWHEIGGYILGFPAEDEGSKRKITYIDKAVRAVYDSTATHVLMHPVSFKDIESIRERDGTILIGWYHSHPQMGIFMSSTDLKNHRSYHSEDYQIAIVIDPIKIKQGKSSKDWIGFFGWSSDGKIMRLPEENIFTTGKKIEASAVISTDSLTPFSAIKQNMSKPINEEESKQQMADMLFRLSRTLKDNRQYFQQRSPIVVMEKAVEKDMLRNRDINTIVRVLIGEIVRFNHCAMMRIETIHSIEDNSSENNKGGIFRKLRLLLSRVKENNDLQLIKKQYEEYNILGFYVSNDIVSHPTHLKELLFQFNLKPGEFSEYLENDCLIVSSQEDEIGNQSLSIIVWSQYDNTFVKVPHSHIIIRNE